ncbi:hypothetical protein [Pseudoruegeria sp. HB172150]|uniref:hypothetical protein n=1 Tax=Pseudoruegeria sp. HB172150 TaxID=2721164 RepID=UPI00155413B2|nr:hypothetical protein [Pseudoruegeria sp. HB172150]
MRSHRIARTVSILVPALLCFAIVPAHAQTFLIRCGPWISNAGEESDDVTIQFNDKRMTLSDGHDRIVAKQVDETELGRVYVEDGDAYFAYSAHTNIRSRSGVFWPVKIVRIVQDPNSVRHMTVSCKGNL